MSARRFLSVFVATICLFPAVFAALVALHVSFEHSFEHPLEHAGGHDHDGPVHLAELAALAEHGHAHDAAEPAHEHPLEVGAAGFAGRRSSASPAGHSIAGAAWVPGAQGALAALCASPRSRTASANGPPLLALLDTLRI